jgi:uncharacterized protein YcgI (DUF1989 family)
MKTKPNDTGGNMESETARQAIARARVPAARGAAINVSRGQYFAVVDVMGGQVVDFWAIDASDYDHYASPPYSIIHNQSLKLKEGGVVVTNRRLPILTVVADEVGQHDLLYPACDKPRYQLYFGVSDHRNCHDNFLEAVADRGWGARPVPFPPFNLFMNTHVESDGRLVTGETTSQPGQKIVFRAEMDLLCVASTCPMDLSVIGGKGITEVEIRVADRLQDLE